MILNAKAREIQIKLSEQGKYVSWQEIIYELLVMYPGCEHIGDLGLGQVDHLEAINELLRLQRRIDTFIISYESRVPLITLLDLEKLICNDYNYNLAKLNANGGVNSLNKINKFEELFLGPLIKNQLVRKIFNIDDEIKSINQLKPLRSNEILKALVVYLQENDLWWQKIKQTDFESFLCEKNNVKMVKMLGMKITNIGMLVGSLKTVQHLYSETLKLTRQNLDEESKQILEAERAWLLKKLNEKLQQYNEQLSDTKELRYQFNSSLNYLKMNSSEIIQDLFNLYEKFFDKNERESIGGFLKSIKQNTFLRDAFQLGICIGKHDLFECLNQIETNLKKTHYIRRLLPPLYRIPHIINLISTN